MRIPYWKDAVKNGLQADICSLFRLNILLQEFLIRVKLNFNKIGDFKYLFDFAIIFPKDFITESFPHNVVHLFKRKSLTGNRGPAQSRSPDPASFFYSTLTCPLTSSSCFLIFAASSFETLSLTCFGTPSTRSFASFSPRPVIALTTLMTCIFLSAS